MTVEIGTKGGKKRVIGNWIITTDEERNSGIFKTVELDDGIHVGFGRICDSEKFVGGGSGDDFGDGKRFGFFFDCGMKEIKKGGFVEG
jgi:hypothetical protein